MGWIMGVLAGIVRMLGRRPWAVFVNGMYGDFLVLVGSGVCTVVISCSLTSYVLRCSRDWLSKCWCARVRCRTGLKSR